MINKTSESTTNIFKAFIKAKGKLVQPMKDASNPFFKSKYVPLPNVIDAIDNAIEGTGLEFFQNAGKYEDGVINITTTLIHESGEWIEFESLGLPLTKVDAQGAGSAITYGRRYALASIFGITENTDDDGQASVGNGATDEFATLRKDLARLGKKAKLIGDEDKLKLAQSAKSFGVDQVEELKSVIKELNK
jgi:hypothetical protein